MFKPVHNIEEVKEKYGLQPFKSHLHTIASNLRLRDAINKVDEVMEYALKLGLPGIAITDHEALSSHVKAYKYLKNNKERFGDFTLGYGDEIYLIDKEEMSIAKENNSRFKFYHFLLIAKNQNGYEGLKKISTQAWKNSFYYKGMERVPTYKDELEKIMEEYKGDIIATTACVGGELSQVMLNYANEERTEMLDIEKANFEADEFVEWCKNLFGNDFYIELQPSKISKDQIMANKLLYSCAERNDVTPIVTTDAHYLNKEQALAHKVYLQASNGEREVEEFYSTTYLMDREELLEFFDEDLLNHLTMGTYKLMESIEEVTFEQKINIPKITIPEIYKPTGLFNEYLDKYKWIKKFYESVSKINLYYMKLIEEGFLSHQQEFNDENLARIDLELMEIWLTSERLNDDMASYFCYTKDVVDDMWNVSLVGVSRGSASCYYTNYLLGIVTINPIVHELPHWRFLSADRPTLPDIDLDAESGRREEIILNFKNKYGWDKVLNIGTFTKEKTKSSLLTTCRGLGIDKDIAHNMFKLIPPNAQDRTMKDIINGNDKKGWKPCGKFVEEIEKYVGMKETIIAIEGITSARSQHASGVIMFPDGYVKQNAMMKTTTGLEVTQFDDTDSEYMGGLKLDFLSINALDRIREAMEIMLSRGDIEWKGDLRKTFNYYFHPDVLEMDEPKMFDMLYNGDVFSSFQFESSVGRKTLLKLNARSFDELCAGNNLMRLSVDDGEQPLDRYIRFKKDISQWYTELLQNNINQEETKVLEDLLLKTYGVNDCQETLMLIVNNPKISNLDMGTANKFRKLVAKANKKELEEFRELYTKSGLENGTRIELLDYIWDFQLKPFFGYGFSSPHTKGYTLILFIEMNSCLRFGSNIWKSACLSVDSGLTGGNFDSSPSWGKVAKAVGEMKDVLRTPDINLSDWKFYPNKENTEVLYSLKAIVGLGNGAIEKIIENRPYNSFIDFLEKMKLSNECVAINDTLKKDFDKLHKLEKTVFTTENPEINFVIEEHGTDELKKKQKEYQNSKNIISEQKVITLIKSGAFKNLTGLDNRKAMIDFVNYIVIERKSLTIVQLPKIFNLAKEYFQKLDDEKTKKTMLDELRLYQAKTYFSAKNPFNIDYETFKKVFIHYYSKEVPYEFDDKGKLIVQANDFDKYFKKNFIHVKEWLKTDVATKMLKKIECREYWISNCSGSYLEWEISTILHYSDIHEFDLIPLDKFIPTVDFNSLPEEPIPIRYNKFKKNETVIEYPVYNSTQICGTVVDKDKERGLVYVLTQNSGVVTVRFRKGQFIHYDTKAVKMNGKEKIVLDDSWFNRGTRLVFVGYRRGEEFVTNHKNSNYNHSTMKINSFTKDDIDFSMEKTLK